MFALVILTCAVMIFSFRARVAAIKKGEIAIKYFKTFEGGNPPEAVVKAGRHFSNLFEVPVLFYAGLIIAMMMPLTGFWIQVWAWLFVVARILHAAIHLGPNKIRPRMLAYALGWVAVLAIWISLLLHI